MSGTVAIDLQHKLRTCARREPACEARCIRDMNRLPGMATTHLLKSSWQWGLLNLTAVWIAIYVLTQGSTGWSNLNTFDSGLESGKWAIRFLLASLTMTPLNTYFGWKSALRLRKSSGLWAFGFASAHVLFYIREAKFSWLTSSMPNFLTLGMAGMLILGALAVTSNRWSMKQLGRNWKRLHRLVYLAGMTVVTHSMLATRMSKKLMFRDPEAIHELRIYAFILCALLVVRIPLVRRLLLQIPVVLRRYRKADPQIATIPMIHGRESGSSVKPMFVIPNELTGFTLWSRAGKQFPSPINPSNDQEGGQEVEAEEELQPTGQP